MSPFDLRLQRTCDHTIFDEVVTINGLSPNYFSILRYGSDGASNFISVREFSRTEGLSNYFYSRDGFTNWILSNDFSQINWNGLTAANFGSQFGGPGTGIAGFVDGASFVSPPQTMVVTYRTTQLKCPLCEDSGDLALTKDTEFDLHGRLRVLEGHDKVRQLIYKALLTETGSNQVIPDYGSTLSAVIGEKFDTLAEFRIYNSVQQAIQFLIDEQANRPDLPLEETILSVSNVNVSQDFTDPRIIRVTLDVQVADFTNVNVSFNLISQ